MMQEFRNSTWRDFLTTVKKPMCIAPWTSMTIAANGEVKIDVLNLAVIGHIDELTAENLYTNEKLKSIMEHHANHKWHPSCTRCQTKEAMVGRSRRTFLEYQFGNNIPASDFTDGRPHVRYLDINCSNKCNLKCTMCNGKISTGWIKDEQRLLSMQGSYHRSNDIGHYSWNPDNLINLFETSDIFDDLKFIALRGGEPLYEPKNFQILDYLIKSRRAKNLILDVSTNGTMLDDKFLGYTKHFNRVDLYVSIEAVGPLYQYIRGGMHFDETQLFDACKRFSNRGNVRLCFAVTVSAQNVLSIAELWQGISVFSDQAEYAFNNVVVNPSYLNFNILPMELRRLSVERIQAAGIPAMIESRHVQAYDSGINPLIDGLIKDIWKEDKRAAEWNKFVAFVRDLDEIRGTDFFAIVPELRRYL